jgi:hypothetical protein
VAKDHAGAGEGATAVHDSEAERLRNFSTDMVTTLGDEFAKTIAEIKKRFEQ